MLQVVLGASFEEDVRLVEQEDGLPASDEVKNLRKTVFKLFRVETEIASTYLFRVSHRHGAVAFIGGDKLERVAFSDILKPLLPSMFSPLPVDRCNSKQCVATLLEVKTYCSSTIKPFPFPSMKSSKAGLSGSGV